MFFVFIPLSLADVLHICHRSDPDINGCIVTSIEKLRPALKVGMPELDIPSIDPMDIGNLLVSENTRANGGLQISANSIRAYGASLFQIKNMQ